MSFRSAKLGLLCHAHNTLKSVKKSLLFFVKKHHIPNLHQSVPNGRYSDALTRKEETKMRYPFIPITVAYDGFFL